MTSISGSSGSNSLSSYFSNKINDLFSQVDTSGDDQISLSEFEAVGQNVPGSASQTGNTGTVAQNSDAASQFKQIDTNGDGQLSKDEVTSYVQQQLDQKQSALTNIQELFGGGASKAGGHHGGHHHHASSSTDSDSSSSTTDASGSSTDNSSDPLSALLAALSGASGSSDSNSSTDGSSSDSLFSAIDSNGDGSISQGELSSYLSQQQNDATNASSNPFSSFDNSQNGFPQSSQNSISINGSDSSALPQIQITAYINQYIQQSGLAASA